MDVSDQQTPDGQELISQLVKLTNLPEHWIQEEIGGILESTGKSVETPEDLTLEGLRAAMVAYLEELILAEEAEALQQAEAASLHRN